MRSVPRRPLMLMSVFSTLILASCIPAQNQEPVRVIILAGQSNMQGAGNFEALSQSQRISVERASKTVQLTFNSAPPYSGSLRARRSPAKVKKYGFEHHFGPEIFLGVDLAKAHPETNFLIIKKAVGGTSLYGAWHPSWTPERGAIEPENALKRAQLFKSHVSQVKIELDRLDANERPYKIMGVGWLQGESDTGNAITSDQYQDNLTQLITAYRNALGRPDLPFIIGQVNPPSRKRNIDGAKTVRVSMERIAQTMPNIKLIKTKASAPWTDYPKHDDNIHYNTQGQIKLGQAFAKSFLSFDVD